MFQEYFQHFLRGHKEIIHMAGHSHHFWPDASRKGHLLYWDDSAKFSDQKWDFLLGHKLNKVQSIIANIIGIKEHSSIAFAPNTHELVSRLLSCFTSPIKVLTTNGEFHSFSRQLKRIEEQGWAQVTRLDPESESFNQQLKLELSKDYDLIFISHVFFNSGKVFDLKIIEDNLTAINENTLIVIDGYHGFCAIPTDLSKLEHRVFYLAGGYKYAQAGEGMCFMTIPKSHQNLRPLYTGWFANFAELSKQSGDTEYSSDAFRFWGSTQDLSAHYRFLAVWEEYQKDNICVEKIHQYIKELQKLLIENCPLNWIETELDKVGHFLTLKLSSNKSAKEAYDYLLKNNIMTDFRDDRLRFGFGAYLSKDDINSVIKAIQHIDFTSIVQLK